MAGQHHGPQQQQMTFSEIGTLYNSISNEVEGGVTGQNQSLLLSQVSTVQTQLQNLIDSGALNNLDGAGNAAVSLVHAQNVVDQMNFLKTEIGSFGTDAFVPKFINDVVRDIQDIVAGDPQLAALAHQGNHSGFQQVSFLLTPPAPFPDSVGDDVFSADGQHVVSAGADGVLSQTGHLLNFIDDSNSLAARAQALAGHDPNGADKAAMIAQLETDINAFTAAADAYSTAQGGLFSARFNNEFTLNGVQGTASREMITGLETGNADLVNGAASVLTANAMDVRTNMLANGLTADGKAFVPVANGIPDHIDTVNVAGIVFDDAVTKLVGGVYSGNQASIEKDLSAVETGLTNAISNQNITGRALFDIQHAVKLLGQESTLVSGIDTNSLTPISAVNGQINNIQAQILNIINHDATLSALATGVDADGNTTTGFVALPPGKPGPVDHHFDFAGMVAQAAPATTGPGSPPAPHVDVPAPAVPPPAVVPDVSHVVDMIHHFVDHGHHFIM
jgi:hypothetical protein